PPCRLHPPRAPPVHGRRHRRRHRCGCDGGTGREARGIPGVILREALAGARERLRISGSDEADIEAEVLMRYALGIDRATFLQLLSEPISAAETQTYERVLARRFAGEPTAYITGTREFYGLDFSVTPATLIPRPETEMLVEAAIHGAPAAPTLVDVGTGSG